MKIIELIGGDFTKSSEIILRKLADFSYSLQKQPFHK